MSEKLEVPVGTVEGHVGFGLCPVRQPYHLADHRTYVGVLTLIIGVACLARVFTLFTASIDADEGVYLVMAQQWQHGGLPYVAVWDQHPPGLPALLVAVLDIVFDPVLGAHLAASAAVMATAVLIHLICWRHAYNARAGLIAALLYVICISRWPGLSANTEIFNNFLVTFAAYHLIAAARRPSGLPRAVMAALVLGVGLQFKYVVFPEAVLFSLAYLVASYRRNRDLGSASVAAGFMILAGLLPTVFVVGYFWSKGALQTFLSANIGANVTYVALVPPIREIVYDSAGGMLPIIGAVLTIGYGFLCRAKWRPRWSATSSLQAWIFLWIVAAALDVCLPMKFFRHYFFALYPPGLSWCHARSGRLGGGPAQVIRLWPGCFAGDPGHTLGNRRRKGSTVGRGRRAPQYRRNRSASGGSRRGSLCL